MAHNQEVVSSNPDTVYWMDVSDASYYIQIMKIKKIKVAHWGTPKKYLKKQNNLVDASKYIKFQINIKVKHNCLIKNENNCVRHWAVFVILFVISSTLPFDLNVLGVTRARVSKAVVRSNRT
jgi:hypothetical protein